MHVKVPVLSVNIYLTYPNSSFFVQENTLRNFSFSAANLTNSKVTIKLIGIKVFNSKKYYANVIPVFATHDEGFPL